MQLVAFFEKFITGRLRKRLLRAPAIEGWRWDEQGLGPPARAKLALESLDDGAMGVRIPDYRDPGRMSAEAAAIVQAAAGELEITVGWPEQLVILRKDGAVIYAEGDVAHFGALPLDPVHTVRRSGYTYINEDSAEVNVELQLDVSDEVTTVLLGPNESTTAGPYTIAHERSYDPSDRPSTLRQHAYYFRVRRAPGAPVPPPPDASVPHPLDVATAEEVIAIARRCDALTDVEALVCEPDILRRHLQRYEGATAQLEESLRACGPHPPTLRRLGETLEVTGARLARGDKGQCIVGRATVCLHPCRTVTVAREQVGTAPGRLRRPSTSR